MWIPGAYSVIWVRLADARRRVGAGHERSNGTDGLEKAQALQPDLILMDLVIPGMDGLDAMRRLRELPTFKDMPIIVLSSSASADDQYKSLLSGANAFVAKPIERGRLCWRKFPICLRPKSCIAWRAWETCTTFCAGQAVWKRLMSAIGRLPISCVSWPRDTSPRPS
ncbi:response regulator [Rhodoferax ferrireducens]|uniref:response regulator n=1 Tax=Rhodoferax ferrireducens TaxID=192843 RepID=UPI000E0D636E|nr:response regulator [Rhodoferax ferrireducens]